MNILGTILFVSIALTLVFKFDGYSKKALCKIIIIGESYPVFITKKNKQISNCKTLIKVYGQYLFIKNNSLKSKIKINETFNF